MYIERVKAGTPLSAVNENRKIETINELSDRVNSIYTPPSQTSGIIVTARNFLGSTIQTGTAFKVSDIRHSGSKDALTKTYLNSGIQVNALVLTPTTAVTGIALESAKSGKLFKAMVLGAVGAIVHLNSSSHTYANTASNKLESASYGEWHIIGNSNPPSSGSGSGSGSGSFRPYDAFCLLSPNVMGGHLVGTLQNTIQGSSGTGSGGQVRLLDTAQDVYVDNVTCPLLRDSETIQANSIVVLSWNNIAKRLEIIEAQCPSEGSDS